MDGRIRPVRRRGGFPASAPVRVVAVLREGARWTLRLSGTVNAVLEYDGRRPGREVVRLNEQVVAQASTFHGYNRRFELMVATAQGKLPLVLEVRVSLWAAIEAVTLHLNGQKLYYEDTFRSLEPTRPSLPVPVDAAALAAHTLPRPLPEPPLDVTRLPRAVAEFPSPPAARLALRAELSGADLARARRTRTIAALLALAGGFLG